MGQRPDAYDPRFCEMQDQTIDEVVTRVQKLVDEYHGVNVKLASIDGQLGNLRDRVPADLQPQLTTHRITLNALHDDFRMLRSQFYALIGAIMLSAIGAFVSWLMAGRLK